MYDIIIIWAGASGLFLASILPKTLKVLLLEKNEQAWAKLLLTWNGRCNFSNKYIDSSHYQWEGKEKLDVFFSEFSVKEFCNYLNSQNIEYKEEDQWRLLLKSNKSSQLLNHFLDKINLNWFELKTGIIVNKIEQQTEDYCLHTSGWDYTTKKIVLACWWKTFPQIGGTDFIFHFAKDFGIQYQSPYPALNWLATKENLSSLSWSSVFAKIELKQKDWRVVYTNEWTVLFTHQGVSWPVIFNLSLFIASHQLYPIRYTLKLSIPKESMTKRLFAYIKNAPKELQNYFITLHPIFSENWNTAKVMAWGVLLSELTDSFEIKKLPWGYVLWEAINITWETGGFNLQWCWTTAYFCAKSLINYQEDYEHS